MKKDLNKRLRELRKGKIAVLEKKIHEFLKHKDYKKA